MLNATPNPVQMPVKKEQKTNNLYNMPNKLSLFKQNIAEVSMWVLFLKLIKATRIPFISGKHQLIQTFKEYLEQRPFPWFKLSLLALVLYMVFQKDMHFQINMKSPITLFSAGREDANGKPTALSMSLPTLSNKSAINQLQLTDEKVKAYIERFSRISMMEMQKFHIPASIKMGQAILASQAGDHLLATKYNNHFGTICSLPEDSCEQYDSAIGNVKIKKYASAWESWRDHSEAISKAPFTTLQAYGKDYKQWAKGISKIGYGDNKEYTDQLIQIIEQYQLYKLDELSERL